MPTPDRIPRRGVASRATASRSRPVGSACDTPGSLTHRGSGFGPTADRYPGSMITALAGGVGAARLLRGLVRVVPPTEVTAVVNTGDDTVLHGLVICPDLEDRKS